MIFLAVVRVGQCEMCSAQFYVDMMPDTRFCVSCGSRVWLYGICPRDSVFIRQGHDKSKKTLNKGVKSKGRQEWSRANTFGKGEQQKEKRAKSEAAGIEDSKGDLGADSPKEQTVLAKRAGRK